MLEIINLILFPLILLMHKIFEIYVQVFLSVGLAIIMLSLTISILFYPLQKKFNKIEEEITKKILKINKEIHKIDANLSGEKRFQEIEKIYKRFNYHPIHNIGIGAGFFLLLPILLSAMLMLSNNEILINVPFLFIIDLSIPDNALLGFNILPIFMLFISIVDSKIKFKNDRNSLIKFMIISFVIFILIYNFSSALVLYWVFANIFSLSQTIYKDKLSN